MGMRSAKSLDLIDWETMEEVEGHRAPPSEKYEAIVRYLVKEKFGTIAALCEATELTRPSVQGRILKGEELGTKVLSALAKACGVTFKDLTELPVKQLRAKIDDHLASGSEESETHPTNNEPLGADIYLSILYMQHDRVTEETSLWPASDDPFNEHNDDSILNFYQVSLFRGSNRRVHSSSGEEQPVFAPSCPAGIRISLCGVLSPISSYFQIMREYQKQVPQEEHFAFALLILGKEEKRRFQEIINHVLDLRQALNMAFQPSKPKFCLLVVNDDFEGHTFSTRTEYAWKLKPFLIDEVIEVDHSMITGDSKTYSTGIISRILAAPTRE